MQSLYLVFALQAVLVWVIAAPLFGATISSAPLGLVDVIATLLWLAGFLFQPIADFQLPRFQQRPDAGRAVMNAGLWRYSRHPNYFGVALTEKDIASRRPEYEDTSGARADSFPSRPA